MAQYGRMGAGWHHTIIWANISLFPIYYLLHLSSDFQINHLKNVIGYNNSEGISSFAGQ